MNKTDNNLDKSILYEYNNAGLKTKMTDPSGAEYEYSYDAAGRPDTVEEDGSIILQFVWNARGQRDRLTRKYSDATVGYTDYSYDDLGRLTKVENKYYEGTVFSSFEYTLDVAGNRTKKTYANGMFVDYAYDAAYQLTNETRTSGEFTLYDLGWELDNCGNRVVQDSMLNGQTTYGYTNCLLLDCANGPVDTIEYTYNAAGDTIQETVNSSVVMKTLGYDYEGRMNSFSDNSNDATYKNCPACIGGCGGGVNVRVSTNANNVYTRYFHDGEDVVAEYDSSDTLQRRYFHLGLDETSYMSIESGDNQGEYYYFHDGLGSVTDILNSSGVRVNQYDYYAYGSDYGTPTEGISNRYKFTNRSHDMWSGLYYNRMRYNNTAIGRWSQWDPANQSPYLYLSPVNATDPMGLFMIRQGFAGLVDANIFLNGGVAADPTQADFLVNGGAAPDPAQFPGPWVNGGIDGGIAQADWGWGGDSDILPVAGGESEISGLILDIGLPRDIISWPGNISTRLAFFPAIPINYYISDISVHQSYFWLWNLTTYYQSTTAYSWTPTIATPLPSSPTILPAGASFTTLPAVSLLSGTAGAGDIDAYSVTVGSVPKISKDESVFSKPVLTIAIWGTPITGGSATKLRGLEQKVFDTLVGMGPNNSALRGYSIQTIYSPCAGRVDPAKVVAVEACVSGRNGVDCVWVY